MSTPRLTAVVEQLMREGPIRVAVRLLEAQAALSSAPPESIEARRWDAAMVSRAATELGITIIRSKWPTGAFKGILLPPELPTIKWLMGQPTDAGEPSVPGEPYGDDFKWYPGAPES